MQPMEMVGDGLPHGEALGGHFDPKARRVPNGRLDDLPWSFCEDSTDLGGWGMMLIQQDATGCIEGMWRGWECAGGIYPLDDPSWASQSPLGAGKRDEVYGLSGHGLCS